MKKEQMTVSPVINTLLKEIMYLEDFRDLSSVSHELQFAIQLKLDAAKSVLKAYMSAR